MVYEYKLTYDTYDNLAGEFLIKINLGDSKLHEDSYRVKDILSECDVRVDKKEWKSQFNDYVRYDYKPMGAAYDIVYSLAFKKEYSRNYFIYLINKYYSDLNYYENIYNTKVLIKAGSDEDR